MQRLYFDVHAAVGRTNRREPRVPYHPEALADDLAYIRVHGALVHGQVARDYSYVLGNAQVREAVAADPRLVGCAVVVPGMDVELREGLGYLDALAAQGFRALRLLPRSADHGLSPFLLEEFAAFGVAHRMPLVLDRAEIDFDALYRLLQAFPDWPTLLCGSSWADDRTLFRLMDRCPNLSFDLSDNQAHDVLAVCKEHIGIDRVLYGSDWPNKAPGPIKALVEYSGLGEADRDLVASGNALRLFGLDTARFPLYDEAACTLDGIARKVDAGLPLWDEHVFDAHTHMVDPAHQTATAVPMYRTDAAGMIRSMDRFGIETILTAPWEGILTAEGANRTTLDACRAYPGRILGYACWNPNYPEDQGATISEYHERHGFVGIKPYVPRHGVELPDERYARWFAYGNAHRLVLLVHAETPDVAPQVDVLAQRYPDLTMLLAHSGADWNVARANGAVAKARPNVYAEITYTTLTYGTLEYLVETAGADKVVYGSDMPMRDPAPQLAWVAYARIGENAKRKVLGENARRVLARADHGSMMFSE